MRNRIETEVTCASSGGVLISLMGAGAVQCRHSAPHPWERSAYIREPGCAGDRALTHVKVIDGTGAAPGTTKRS